MDKKINLSATMTGKPSSPMTPLMVHDSRHGAKKQVVMDAWRETNIDTLKIIFDFYKSDFKSWLFVFWCMISYIDL